MVYNAMAGTAVGLTYGLSLAQIKAGIESLEPVDGRFRQISTEKYLIIDDCYNANPVSDEGLAGGAGRTARGRQSRNPGRYGRAWR